MAIMLSDLLVIIEEVCNLLERAASEPQTMWSLVVQELKIKDDLEELNPQHMIPLMKYFQQEKLLGSWYSSPIEISLFHSCTTVESFYFASEILSPVSGRESRENQFIGSELREKSSTPKIETRKKTFLIPFPKTANQSDSTVFERDYGSLKPEIVLILIDSHLDRPEFP